MGTVRIALTLVVFQTTVQTTRRCTHENQPETRMIQHKLDVGVPTIRGSCVRLSWLHALDLRKVAIHWQVRSSSALISVQIDFHESHLVAMTGFEPALRTPWMFRRLPIGLHGHEKWWIQWDSNSHYTAPQAVDSANWSMDTLRRNDSFFTIPQTYPRILDLHQKRLLRLLGELRTP